MLFFKFIILGDQTAEFYHGITIMDLLFFVSIWGFIHSIVYIFHTFTLFIKDMTVYSDINNEDSGGQKEITDILLGHSMQSDEIFKMMSTEIRGLKNRIGELEEELTSPDEGDTK